MKHNLRKPRLRGALVGFGKMAENGHLPGWLREPRVLVQAVCDPNHHRRQRATALIPGVRTYASAEAMFSEESLDFVDICTPPSWHARLILDGLRHGVHVLCEKPFVATRKELQEVRRMVHRQGRIAFPVHNWKDAPVLRRAIDWIRADMIGRVLHSEFHTLRLRPAAGISSWRGRKASAGGGILLDHGWHGIYLLLNFHAQPPCSVSAWTHPPPSALGRVEHTAHLLLGFPDSTGSLFLTWKADRRYNSARIYGQRGYITVEDDLLVLRSRGGRTRTASYRSALSSGSHHPGWFRPLARRFLEAIEDPKKAARELDEVAACLEITAKAYASARRGGTRLPLSLPGGAPRT